jgi:hypothetical protein
VREDRGVAYVIGLPPRTLLSHADVLMTEPPKSVAGRWPGAATVLIRQALERALVQLWTAKAPELARVSQRAQLLVLHRYIDRDLSARATNTWHELSAACHQRAYNLPPTAGELARWFETTEELVREVARVTGRTSD